MLGTKTEPKLGISLPTEDMLKFEREYKDFVQSVLIKYPTLKGDTVLLSCALFLGQAVGCLPDQYQDQYERLCLLNFKRGLDQANDMRKGRKETMQ